MNEIRKLQKEMNMPTKLSDCKVSIENELEIAKLALKDACTTTNPKNQAKTTL